MPETTIATYAAAWLETDPVERLALLMRCWAPEGTYTDPTGTATGRAGLSEHIAAFHAGRPGHRIDVTSAVDGYAAHRRFAWTMRGPEGDVLEGMDYAEVGDDGLIRRIVGFFGPLPA